MLESLPTITQHEILLAAIALVGLYILKRFSGVIKTVIMNTIAGVPRDYSSKRSLAWIANVLNTDAFVGVHKAYSSKCSLAWTARMLNQ